MKKINLLLLLSVMFVLLSGCSKKSPSYKIIWKNYNEDILEVDENVQSGTMPSFDSLTPTRESDGQFNYEFSGWTPVVEEVTSDRVYYATYEEVYLYPQYNGSYVLSHITTESISSGMVNTYQLGMFYFGTVLSKDNISVEINNGTGYLSFNFGEVINHEISYNVFDNTITLYCEEGIDLFGKGNFQNELEILIETVEENTCFVLQASNGTYNFSYYIVSAAAGNE